MDGWKDARKKEKMTAWWIAYSLLFYPSVIST